VLDERGGLLAVYERREADRAKPMVVVTPSTAREQRPSDR
jgi:hypothetical protein